MTATLDVASDWVDPDAIPTMIESVRAAYAAAPGWVQVALPVVLAIAPWLGFWIAASLAGRVVVTVVIAAIAAALWLYGSDADWLGSNNQPADQTWQAF